MSIQLSQSSHITATYKRLMTAKSQNVR